MPIHDWTRATAGTFHDTHISWVVSMTNWLNEGRLPSDMFAMAGQFMNTPAARR